MRPPIEQLKAVLGPNFHRWVSEQVQPNQSMANRRYEDFISVTPADVEQYVLKHGFDPEGDIYESDDPASWKSLSAPEGWYLIKNGEMWEVFYKERMYPMEVEKFSTRHEAVHRLLGRMMKAVKDNLDWEYDNAHRYYPPLDPPLEGAGLPCPPTVPPQRRQSR